MKNAGLRQVCVNGAVMPIVHGMTRFERIATEEIVSSSTFAGGVAHEVREAIRSCATASRLSNAADQMRAMTHMDASVSIAMLMQLIDAGGLPEHVLLAVLERHSPSEDASAFGVVNAVTSVARDTQDPAMRWELESIGGKLVSQATWLPRPRAQSESILGGA
jgi:hypothetical protein